MRLLFALLALLTLLAPRPAHADDGYRTEMVIVDGASLAVVGAGSLMARSRAKTAIMVTGMLGLGFGATVVHAAHDEDRRAWLSATLRYITPGLVTTGFLGYYAFCELGRKVHDGAKPCLSTNVALTVVGLTFLAGVAVDYAYARPPEATAQARMLSFGGAF